MASDVAQPVGATVNAVLPTATWSSAGFVRRDEPAGVWAMSTSDRTERRKQAAV